MQLLASCVLEVESVGEGSHEPCTGNLEENK